ncbi:ubiquitin carboxyl-terminal hydrolase 8-like isoform X2 [Humulus lupulus]|uniref:ubiquitin carboxyl-terminal hydrolase 8-like isoform X2 n=1 Tax=Humulus lupulus TaxID=3486 RepID=UPI002B4108F7|nr:ubiquitin carboxyl-terminal hydrolase 8-like isoform X2 [Humulus lupulus]
MSCNRRRVNEPMTRRLSEKLRLSLLFHKTTRFLSLKLADLSASTLHHCKSFARALASKALALFSMDDVFADDIDFWDPDRTSNYRSQRPRLLDYYDDEDDVTAESEKVFLVPNGWWKEVLTSADYREGVSYSVSLSNDSDSVIVLNLRKDDYAEEGGFSGREYALFTEAKWVRALKRHNELRAAAEKHVGNLSDGEDFSQIVFPLQIKLLVSLETNSLAVKIAKKDNTVDSYKLACNIFILESEPLHIWDFSAKTTKILMNGSASFPNDSPSQPSREYHLQLQVHEFSDSINDRDERDEEMAEAHSKVGGTYDGFVKMNGSTDKMFSYSTLANSSPLGRSFRGLGSLGLTGLQNLGNTCFMNSAIQCLVHTPQLVDFFLGDYCNELNRENPLGMGGDLASLFGELLRKLWAPGAGPVAPRKFKLKIAKFALQFDGYNQHDSQEFLSFLLDGIHEDLNRVKKKPFIEAKDAEGRPDEEAAEEHWKNYRSQNNSIIVDLFHGQYRSMLVCSVCFKLSLTFDPFMSLSLPLPSTTMRNLTLTVLSTDGTTLPSTFTVTVPIRGTFKDLIHSLSIACSLQDDETLLVAEIYKNRVFRFLEDPVDSLALIRDDDRLVAYRLPKESEKFTLVVFMHQEIGKSNHGKISLDQKMFGIPLAASLSDLCYGADIQKQFLKLLNPFFISIEDILNDSGDYANEDNEIEVVTVPTSLIGKMASDSESRNHTDLDVDFQFYVRGVLEGEDILIEMNKPLSVLDLSKKLEVLVLWSDKMIEKYDTSLFSSLPAVSKPQLSIQRSQDSVSLYKCLEAYLKEEPLGPENMWYCPSCQKHQLASKKLDLWTLPEILIIHLKRFSCARSQATKLETYVDFPIDVMDFSTCINQKNSQLSSRYSLYAISNHYGGTTCGHYTSFVRHDNGRWFEFDDDSVFSVSEERIKTEAAYVLFYRRLRGA